MKRLLITTALACSLIGTAHAGDGHEGLDEMDFAWIAKVLGTLYVSASCNMGLELDPDGARLWGDRNGVDVEHDAKAIDAARAAIVGEPYERADIDPRITRVLNTTMDALYHLDGKQKPGVCKQFAELALRDGFAKKVKP